jgi:4-amino-4-deoxy-L-arabinose transferase-like glycosyltransferase
MHPTRISPGFWIALLFVLAGLPFLQPAGLHYDASYELTAFYDCSNVAQQSPIFGLKVPVMIIPYLGAFKAWLYQPLLRYLEVTPFVVRLPTLLVGALSVWIFFILLDRASGRRAAIAAALLLATDSSFVLATSFDFGPVVFLHFLLLSGTLLLLLFDRTRSLTYLGVGFFCFGLALWDKALFIWMLAGLGAAALVVFPSHLRELLSPARVMVAAICLCLGASPLIYYNVISRGATLRAASSSDDVAPFPQKLLVLTKTLNGSVLFGFLTDESGSGAQRKEARHR